MKMHGRRLIHYISIEKSNKTKDSIGGRDIEEWVEFTPAWAEVKPVTGREFLSAQSTQNTITHRIIIRFIDGVSPSMRIKHKDRIFSIEVVRDFFEKEEFLELMCKELI